MKLKRIVAIIVVVLLLGLVIALFISAFFAKPGTNYFNALLLAAIIIPVFVFAYLLIYRLATDKRDEAIKKLEEEMKARMKENEEAGENEEAEDNEESQLQNEDE